MSRCGFVRGGGEVLPRLAPGQAVWPQLAQTPVGMKATDLNEALNTTPGTGGCLLHWHLPLALSPGRPLWAILSWFLQSLPLIYSLVAHGTLRLFKKFI